MELKIDYPDALPDALQTSRAEFEQEARMALAVKLYERKRISSGVVAQLARVDRVRFLLDLHQYRVSIIDYEVDNA